MPSRTFTAKSLKSPVRAITAVLATALVAGAGTTVVGAGAISVASASAINSENTAQPGQEVNDAGAPKDGGTLHIGMSADPLCLDPHQISSDVEQLIGNIQFDNLTFLGKDGLPQPWLATSWTISPNGKTYVFQLKKGVTFADGAAFNAAAVVANFNQMLAPATRSALAGPYIEPVQSTKILGPYTLQVNLSYAYSPFLYVLAQGWLGMESPKSLAADTPAQLCQHPVGSGPFVLTNYTENVGVTYVARKGYNWGPPELGQSGGPHLAGIDLSWIGQDPVRYDSLVSGQTQLTQYVPAQDAAQLKSNSNFIYEDIDRIGWPFTFDFNTTSFPVNNVLVRKAIIEGVNTQDIVDTAAFGQHAVATSYLDPVTKYYDPAADAPRVQRGCRQQALGPGGLVEKGLRPASGSTTRARSSTCTYRCPMPAPSALCTTFSRPSSRPTWGSTSCCGWRRSRPTRPTAMTGTTACWRVSGTPTRLTCST